MPNHRMNNAEGRLLGWQDHLKEQALLMDLVADIDQLDAEELRAVMIHAQRIEAALAEIAGREVS